RPGVQDARLQRAEAGRVADEGRRDRVELRLQLRTVEVGLGPALVLDRRLGIAEHLRVAADQRGDGRPGERGLLVERAAGGDDDELGVGRGAVVVDAELARAWTAGA